MIPQLVGLSCAICQERIGSSIDGRFCDACGNPIHDRCSKCPPGPASNDDVLSAAEAAVCPRCGADPKTPVAIYVREAYLHQRIVAEVAPRRAVAQKFHNWKQLSFGLRILGTVTILASVIWLNRPPDPERPASEAENRFAGYVWLVLSTLLTAGSFLFGWYKRHAEREHQRVAWGEDEEPRE